MHVAFRKTYLTLHTVHDLDFIQKCGKVHAECTITMTANTRFRSKACAGMFLQVVITSEVGPSEFFQLVTLDPFIIAGESLVSVGKGTFLNTTYFQVAH